MVSDNNLLSHITALAQSALKSQGNWLLFLPRYLPVLNPIEMAYSKLKARIFYTFFQSVAQTYALFPADERRNLFKAAAYFAD